MSQNFSAAMYLPSSICPLPTPLFHPRNPWLRIRFRVLGVFCGSLSSISSLPAPRYALPSPIFDLLSSIFHHRADDFNPSLGPALGSPIGSLPTRYLAPFARQHRIARRPFHATV